MGFGLFGPFLAIFGRFWHFWGFSGDLGVLEVPVSYKITRGIILVVGRVTEEVMGGLREFWGVLGRSGGVYLTPIGQVLPLWKSFRALDLGPNTIK